MNNIENDGIQLFEDQKIRVAWDEQQEEWYFSVVDVVAVLTEQPTYDGARNYWKVLKNASQTRAPSWLLNVTN